MTLDHTAGKQSAAEKERTGEPEEKICIRWLFWKVLTIQSAMGLDTAWKAMAGPFVWPEFATGLEPDVVEIERGVLPPKCFQQQTHTGRLSGVRDARSPVFHAVQ